jgi:hypothetical protein
MEQTPSFIQRFLRIGFLLLATTIAYLAQVTSGSIYGTVTDPQGAPVANAKILITDLAKNTQFEVVSNETGNYERRNLLTGIYRVVVEATGFKKSTLPEVSVNVDVAARVDFRMELGTVDQTVEVTAAAPLLRSDKAEVASLMSAKQVSDIPSFNRNFQALQLLTPGTQRVGWQHASSENPQGSVQIQVNGQHFSGTDYQLDGTSNQDPILGIIVINPTIDSIVENKVSTQNYDAEFGLAAAGVGIVSTKSGTNSLHGSLFHFLQNNSPGFQTSAVNPFNRSAGAPPVKWNQFGGSLGGALIKNKLFYFGDAQLTRRRTGSSVLQSVPTVLARSGNFSQYIESGRNLIYDPLTGNQATGLGRTQFPNNTIPTNRLDPRSVRLLSGIPLPNAVDPGGTAFRNNYVATGSENFDSEQWNTRWDWFQNDKTSLFGRYSQADYRKFAPGAFGNLVGGAALNGINFAGQSNVRNQSLAVGATRTWSPTIISDFRMGFMRYKVDVDPNGLGTTPATDAGIPNLNRGDDITSGMPAFQIEGDGGFNFGYGLGVNQCNCPLRQNERQWQFNANTTHIQGNHTIKWGVDYRYAMNLRVPSDDHRSGEMFFRPGVTGIVDANGRTQQGVGLATYMLGTVQGFRRFTGTSTTAEERQPRMFFFGQDSWRISNKLQLNYGLRWELIFPERVNAPGNGAALDLRTGEIAVFGVGGVPIHGIQNLKKTNFAPRLGITYQLDPKTVVRAGYGWSYALGTFGSIFGHNVTQNLPVLARQNLNAANDFSGVFNLAQGPPNLVFPTPNSQGRFLLPNGVRGNARPLETRLPRSMAYNLTLQRQLTSNIAVDAGYVGNVGRHVFNGNGPDLNVNQPIFSPGIADTNLRRPYFSRYGWTQDVFLYCNCATSRYDSLQMNLVKNDLGGRDGWTGRLTYTLQRNIQDDGDAYTFLYDRPLGRGNAEFIARNTVTGLMTYDVPFGKGRKFGSNLSKAADILLGGWAINGTTYWRSGIPFTPFIGEFASSAIRPNSGPAGRPNEPTGDVYANARTRDRWFNGGLSVWGVPANNQFGNFPIRGLFGPHFFNQDLSIFKNFTIREGTQLQFRTEAFNAFNNTQLGDPNGNITAGNVGQITGLAGGAAMRRLQFALRLNF